MNKDIATLLFLGAICGFMLEFVISLIWTAYDRMQAAKIAKTLPRLLPYEERRRCREPHKWALVILALKGIEPGEYDVCQNCGLVANGEDDLMLSPEGVEQLKETLEAVARKDAAKEALALRIRTYTEEALERYIVKHFPEEINDPEFVTRLNDLILYAAEAQKNAAYKAAVEDEAQGDAQWSDQEGNA